MRVLVYCLGSMDYLLHRSKKIILPLLLLLLLLLLCSDFRLWSVSLLFWARASSIVRCQVLTWDGTKSGKGCSIKSDQRITFVEPLLPPSGAFANHNNLLILFNQIFWLIMNIWVEMQFERSGDVLYICCCLYLIFLTGLLFYFRKSS